MKIIITGSTGMVGKAVLLEALEDDRISEILLINRSTIDITHDKITEVLLADFTQIASARDQLHGYDAIFHCMGVSAVGKSEAEYAALTFDITKAFADVLYDINPQMVFNYVSGTGTDSSEKGRSMWARVKGRTENYILSKGFKDAYMIRLGAILPEKGIKSRTHWYGYVYLLMRPFNGLLKKSKHVITTTNFGKAMLNTVFYPSGNKYPENIQLNALATKNL